MGIEVQSLRLLLLARALGAKFDSCLTIGRQDFIVSPEQIGQVFADFGDPVEEDEAVELARGRAHFSEPLFEKLGATTVDSMDTSDFEGATVIHDLNTKLPDELSEKYSLVFDGGTLEHVFNLPEAIKAYMSLTSLGGHLVLALPANNQVGHGFYQFSPELFFRTLTDENGFRVKAMFLAPLFNRQDWYSITDPATVGYRGEYNPPFKMYYVFVVAQRTAVLPLLSKTPYQSDYAAIWAGPKTEAHRPRFDRFVARKPSRIARALVPKRLRVLRKRLVEARRVLRQASAEPDPSHFQKFTPNLASARRFVAASGGQ